MRVMSGVGFAVLLACATTIHGATLSTGDGLGLQLDDATGAVRALEVGKEKAPLLPGVEGGFYITDVGKAAAEGAANLLKNAGLEEGKDAQGLPGGWGCDSPSVTAKFVAVDDGVRHSGKSSLRLQPDPEEKLMSGVGMYQWIPLEKDAAYRFSGWVKSELKGTSVRIALSYYSAETKWLDAEYIRVEAPTDWKQVTRLLLPSRAPKDAVKIMVGLCLEKKQGASGAAWFDDVAFAKCEQKQEALHGSLQRVSKWLFFASKGQFSQRMKFGSLEVEARHTAKPDHILVEGEVRDVGEPQGKHALQLVYDLPINAAGWRWGDDIRTSRVIEKGKSYGNAWRLAGHEISVYPFSSVSGERAGLSLAVPMDESVVQWASYDSSKGLLIGFDLGLSAQTKKLGPGRASFSFVIYAHEPEWGLRAAAKKYYDIFPQFFAKRTKGEGLWACPAGGGNTLPKIPNIEDFGIGFLQGGMESDKLQKFFKEHGIATATYVEPTVEHLIFPEANAREEMLSLRPKRLERIREWAKGDEGPKGWFLPHFVASWDRQENQTAGGKASLRFSMPSQFTKEKPGPSGGGVGGSFVESAFIPAKPNAKYRFSAWGKLKGKEGSVFLRALDQNGGIIGTQDYGWVYHGSQAWKEGEAEWVKKEAEFVTEPNCTQLQVGAGMSGWGSFWVDDLELVEAGPGGGNLIPNGSFEESGRNCYRWGSSVDGLRAEVSQAILNSLPLSPTGEEMLGDVDRYTYWHWRLKQNTDPDLAHPNRADIVKARAYGLLARSQADGVHLDSMQSSFGAYYNCRREHLEVADVPLTFDFDTGEPALLGTLSHCEFVQWIADDLHKKGKLLHSNIESDSRYYVTYFDFYGGEVGSWGSGQRKLYEVEPDARANAKRTLAYQKWVSNLLQEEAYQRLDERTSEPLSHEQIEQYIQHQMFYGIWPGISAIGGGSALGYLQFKRYFSSPEFYERDRDLFKRYIPVLRRITEAGWEPVTYATTSDAKVWIERFGYWDKNNLHFTIRNSTPEERKATVKVHLAQLANGKMSDVESLLIEEVISGARLPARVSAEAGKVEFDIGLKSYETTVVSVKSEAAERLPKP